jgi:uncharacterized protein DUF5681
MPAKGNAKYAVGFGKPPRRTRFKKGRSGNPKGRPRGSRTSLTLLEQALSELVVVTENGQRKQITKGEAMLKQLVNKAASGDPRAMQMLLGEIRSLEDHLESRAEVLPGETKAQMLLLERLTVPERLELRRLIAKAQGDAEHPEADLDVDSSPTAEEDQAQEPAS